MSIKIGCSFLIIFSCNHSTESGTSHEFSKMEIHYSKTIGVSGSTSQLDIFGDGTVQKFSDIDDSLTSSRGVLTTTQQDSLIQLFSNFSQYDPEYFASVADGDDHIIVYIYEGKTETVRVYSPSEANIPESLQNIITYLGDL